MDQVLKEPLFYIFFIYGLSFIVMAFVVLIGIKRATSITLVTTFYTLVIFGFTHGLTEWIDWTRFIIKVTGGDEVRMLVVLSQFFLVVSFVVLLQFGINLLTYRNEKKSFIRSVPVLLLALYIAALLIAGVNDFMKAGLIARRSFGFAGSLLSGIALFRLSGSMKLTGNSRLVKGLAVTAVGFVSYAVFGGLIINPVAGLPVQLFRAACALTIAASSFSILGVFEAGR